MSRKRSARRKRKSRKFPIKFLCFLLLFSVVVWLAVTAWRAFIQVEQLPESKGHAYIAQQVEEPVLLVAKQSAEPAKLDSLMVIKIDWDDNSLGILELPTNLSDGKTTIGQYLESHYYKEMQLAVEGQLALPLTGYIIEPRPEDPQAIADEQESFIDALALSPAPSWWQSTAGLPLWLDSLADVKTNLSIVDMLRLTWLVRDASSAGAKVVTLPPGSNGVVDGNAVLVAETVDPVVREVFVSDSLKRQAISVVVKNATQVTGLASLTSRYVANMGGEIVAVEPADTSQTNSSITAEKSTPVSDAVEQFLGIPLTQKAQTGRERAEIELVIGADALVRMGK